MAVFKDESDHDLLVQVASDIKHLGKILEDHVAQNRTIHDKLHGRISQTRTECLAELEKEIKPLAQDVKDLARRQYYMLGGFAGVGAFGGWIASKWEIIAEAVKKLQS